MNLTVRVKVMIKFTVGVRANLVFLWLGKVILFGERYIRWFAIVET